ncbi:unnamed protein product [Prorocentrum cordatum]|uniref:Tr-type G domain-containing protein n=1 Tax=Prorocentrum cordatum TaxID=2364126 RepID=A0ABN9WS11_9DINO|nr:unnamed protein product [Polarella glacialis]
MLRGFSSKEAAAEFGAFSAGITASATRAAPTPPSESFACAPPMLAGRQPANSGLLGVAADPRARFFDKKLEMLRGSSLAKPAKDNDGDGAQTGRKKHGTGGRREAQLLQRASQADVRKDGEHSVAQKFELVLVCRQDGRAPAIYYADQFPRMPSCALVARVWMSGLPTSRFRHPGCGLRDVGVAPKGPGWELGKDGRAPAIYYADQFPRMPSCALVARVWMSGLPTSRFRHPGCGLRDVGVAPKGPGWELGKAISQGQERWARLFSADGARLGGAVRGLDGGCSLDARGHEHRRRDFCTNLISTTSMADIAALVVPAVKEEFEAGVDSGRIFQLALACFTMGIKNIAVIVSKMDHPSVDYDSARYEEIKKQVGGFLKEVGYKGKEVPFVPVSGLSGDNLTTKSAQSAWYGGKALIDTLDEMGPINRPAEKPLRMPVLRVQEVSGAGVVITGRLETGALRSGIKLKFCPGGQEAEAGSAAAESAQSGQALCEAAKEAIRPLPVQAVGGLQVCTRRAGARRITKCPEDAAAAAHCQLVPPGRRRQPASPAPRRRTSAATALEVASVWKDGVQVSDAKGGDIVTVALGDGVEDQAEDAEV